MASSREMRSIDLRGGSPDFVGVSFCCGHRYEVILLPTEV